MGTNKEDFNFNRDKHPERMPDEVWITNASDENQDFLVIQGDNFEPAGSGFDRVGWKTKRKGSIAYDKNGAPLGASWPGAYPIFAKQSEIEKEDPKILKRLLPKP